jgi:hypothetical protein
LSLERARGEIFYLCDSVHVGIINLVRQECVKCQLGEIDQRLVGFAIGYLSRVKVVFLEDKMTIYSRRGFVTGVAGLVTSTAIFGTGHSATSARRNDAKEELSKEKWMAELMKQLGERASDSPLHLGRFKDPMYYLLDPISWSPNQNQLGKFDAVEVPKGFVSDLASIPRPFWSLLRPDGTYAYAAIIHDYLYWVQTGARESADEILKNSMEDFGIDATTKNIIYLAVRAAGQGAWDQNSKLKAHGEKRLLKAFPANARTLWADWRRNANVFSDQ